MGAEEFLIPPSMSTNCVFDCADAVTSVISSITCPVMTESVVWGFIDTYLEFLKSFLIIMGFYFTLFGRRMEDVLHCGAGYLTVVALAIFIFSF